MDEAKNLNFIRKFYYYIGLIPSFNEDFTAYKFAYIKTSLWSLFLASAVIFKHLNEGFHSHKSKLIVAYLTLSYSVGNFIMIILCVIKFSTWHAPKLGKLFQTLNEADAILQQLKAGKVPVIHCKWLLLTFMVLVTVLSMFGGYAFRDIGVKLILLGGVDHMAMTYTGFINVLWIQLLIFAQVRFNKLNRILSELNVQSTCITLDATVKLHNTLCNYCAHLQDLFGWPILIYITQLMIFTLGTIELIRTVEFGVFDRTSTLHFSLALTILEGVIIAGLCQAVSAEGKNTSSLICDFINVNAHANTFLLDKMQYFLQQAREKQPRFTAASFFPIDNSMFFMFVNWTATYIIVLIQFN